MHGECGQAAGAAPRDGAPLPRTASSPPALWCDCGADSESAPVASFRVLRVASVPQSSPAPLLAALHATPKSVSLTLEAEAGSAQSAGQSQSAAEPAPGMSDAMAAVLAWMADEPADEALRPASALAVGSVGLQSAGSAGIQSAGSICSSADSLDCRGYSRPRRRVAYTSGSSEEFEADGCADRDAAVEEILESADQQGSADWCPDSAPGDDWASGGAGLAEPDPSQQPRPRPS